VHGASLARDSTSAPEIKFGAPELPPGPDCLSGSGVWGSPSISTHLSSSEDRLGPHSSIGARLWIVFGILAALFGCGGCAYFSVVASGPKPFVIVTSASSLAVRRLYFVLSVSGVCIFVFYILKGAAGSTVVPCMNSLWYKSLNVLIISLALVAFVLAALETKISATGAPTTYQLPPP